MGRHPEKRVSGNPSPTDRGDDSDRSEPRIRIIGGSLRGRSVPYLGDPRTRPMKDRVRESVFNLLADSVVGQDVIDLFAGTGAIGLESLSRGAAGATFIERHVPTARRIRATLADWGLESRARVETADSFFWLRHDWKPSSTPTLLFCSPPYASYVAQRDALCEILTDFGARAVQGSRIVVESDDRFDAPAALPGFAWRVRAYPPAILAIGSPALS